MHESKEAMRMRMGGRMTMTFGVGDKTENEKSQEEAKVGIMREADEGTWGAWANGKGGERTI